MNMYKLLIVDDNQIQIQSLLEFIDWKKFGITEIVTAYNGEEGLAAYKKTKPDIIITDVVMPIMDGVEMTKRIRGLDPRAKFIFVSCYENFGYLKQAMDNDVVAYILIPIDPAAVEEAINKLIREIEEEQRFASMEHLLDESLDVFRENFLCRFLYSNHIDKIYLKSTLHNLGFDRCRCFAVVKTELLNDNVYSMLKTAKNTLFRDITGYAIIETETRCVLIFMSEDDDQTALINQIKQNLTEVIDTQSEKNIVLAAGLSSVKFSLNEVPYLLNQADSAVERCLFTSGEGIVEFENGRSTQPHYEISEIKDALDLLLADLSDQQLRLFLDKYYPPGVSKNYAKTLCVSVITTLQLILLEHNYDIKDLFEDSSIVWKRLDDFDSIANTHQWLYNMINTILNFLNDMEKSKYNKIVDDIKQVINQGYSSISNIEQIADSLHISSSYAKSLFKKYTGQTVFDYLFEKRMEQAKQLLSDPYRKVYEVADMVGYKSKAYFSEAFRRYTGLTPRDYQQNKQT